jgi:hypothetical protein
VVGNAALPRDLSGIVDQLLYSDLVNIEDCDDLLRTMAVHTNPKIREQHAALMDLVSGNDTA